MNCPRCGADGVHVDSSRELQISEIGCIDCGLGFQAAVTEECVEKIWAVIKKEDTADDGHEEDE